MAGAPVTAAQKMGLILSACAALIGSGGLIAREGWITKGYKDPVHGAKVPTACAGVTKGVVLDKEYGEDGCVEMTLSALIEHAGPIAVCLPDTHPLPSIRYVQEQVDLTYNIGIAGYRGSSMCSRMKVRDYRGACDAILEWKKAGGQDCSAPGNHTCPGLWQSRLKARDACLKAGGLQ